MKRVLLAVVALLAMSGVKAQVHSYRNMGGENPGVVYMLPRTVLTIDIVCERESVRKGPYARFSQKYLGVIAPLADKDVYRIAGASISYSEEADPSQSYVLENMDRSPFKLFGVGTTGPLAAAADGQSRKENFDVLPDDIYMFPDLGLSPMIEERVTVSYIDSDTGNLKIPVDKREVVEKTLEEQAEAAVKTLFDLRKRRLDLITGEAGENVFGAGLEAALNEIKRLENEYISLFLGKSFKQQIVRRYKVVPEQGKNTVIVCRFSSKQGLVSLTDLSGTPVVLQMTPENKAANSVLPSRGPKDTRGTVYLRAADVANCRLVDGNKEIVSERIPIYQFGTILDVPVPSTK